MTCGLEAFLLYMQGTMLSYSRVYIVIFLTTLAQDAYATAVQRNQRMVCVFERLISNGSDSISCACGNSSCNSFGQALENLTSNVLINVTTDVTLSSLINLSDIENVTIFGHKDPIVKCKNFGAIRFIFCNNCIIQGITWDECGTDNAEPSLMIVNSSNIMINNCSFHHSKGQAVLLSEVSGYVKIFHSNFSHNSNYRGNGAAIHYSSSIIAKYPLLMFIISDCNFTYNKFAKSLVYIKSKTSDYFSLTFHQSNFCHNQGVSIYAVNQSIYFSGTHHFQNNAWKNGMGIYISDYSTVTFDETSNVKFTQNLVTGDYSGMHGSIFSRNHSNIIFEQNSMALFDNNEANIMYSEFSAIITFKTSCNVTFSNNLSPKGAIFSNSNSCVIFEGNATVIFNGNTGAIHSSTNCRIVFEENSSPLFVNNKYGTTLVSLGLTSATILSRHNSLVIFKGDSSPVFSNNTIAAILGWFYFGSARRFMKTVIYSESYSSVIFEGSSSPVFSNNTDQGEILSAYSKSSIYFREYSSPVFINNVGKIIHSFDNCHIYFEGNSSPVFSNNTFYGAIISFSSNSYMYFRGNSSPVFTNNVGRLIRSLSSFISYEGNSSPVFTNNSCYRNGIILSSRNSRMVFRGNSTPVFTNNVVRFYGIIYSSENSTIVFKENSSPVFNSNTARSGGAIYFSESYVHVEQNASPVFNNNTADNGGAIFSTNKSHIFIAGNSSSVFSDNIATNGGAIYCSSNSSISFQGHSTISFRNNIAGYGAGHYSQIIFNDSSKMIFSHDEATFNSIIFTSDHSKIVISGNFTAVFNDILARWCNNTCLPYTGQNDVVRINSDGIVWCTDRKSFICASEKCYCKKLEELLMGFKSDSLSVNITNTVTLSSVFSHLPGINGASINGYNNAAVICINGGGLRYGYLNDLTIVGITWIGCGDDINQVPVIYLQNTGQITIRKCTFQHSMGIAILIARTDIVTISHCNFMNNNHYSDHGVAIHGKLEKSSNINIYHCIFSNNGEAKSVVYFFNPTSPTILSINTATFINNQGVSVYLARNNFLHISEKVLFKRNLAEDGAGIYISGASKATFGANSITNFINNSVYFNGAAIFLADHSNVIFQQNSVVTFNDNKATNGTVYCKAGSNVIFKGSSEVLFRKNSVTHCGTAIYSIDNSHVIFTGNSNVSFSNNVASSNDVNLQHSGTILSENNGHILFEEDSFTMFSDNIADFGAGIFSFFHSGITFKDNSTVNFYHNVAQYCGVMTSVLYSIVIYKGNTMVTYNANTISFTSSSNYELSAVASAMCTFQITDVIFSGHSLVTYINNTAGGGGAAVFSESYVIIEKYSTVKFNNNAALSSSGGAFTCCNNSKITSTGNSSVNFNGNKASQDGGAIYSYNMCKITFQNNSKSTFSDNIARNNGGAIFSNQFLEITFNGHSNICFNGNRANNGGVFYLDNSSITIKEWSLVSFYNSKASQDGEQYIHTICARSHFRTTLNQPLVITSQEIMVVPYLAISF